MQVEVKGGLPLEGMPCKLWRGCSAAEVCGGQLQAVQGVDGEKKYRWLLGRRSEGGLLVGEMGEMATEQFTRDWLLVKKVKWPVARRRSTAGGCIGRDW